MQAYPVLWQMYASLGLSESINRAVMLIDYWIIQSALPNLTNNPVSLTNHKYICFALTLKARHSRHCKWNFRGNILLVLSTKSFADVSNANEACAKMSEMDCINHSCTWRSGEILIFDLLACYGQRNRNWMWFQYIKRYLSRKSFLRIELVVRAFVTNRDELRWEDESMAK